jgi:hypothetical protein
MKYVNKNLCTGYVHVYIKNFASKFPERKFLCINFDRGALCTKLHAEEKNRPRPERKWVVRVKEAREGLRSRKEKICICARTSKRGNHGDVGN